VSKLRVETHDMGKGIWQFTCFSEDWPSPVGMAWVLGFGGSPKSGCQLFDCFTSLGMRRQGVMTEIINVMLKKYDYVFSDGVTKEGRSFMKRTGWKYRRETSDWYKTRSNR